MYRGITLRCRRSTRALRIDALVGGSQVAPVILREPFDRAQDRPQEERVDLEVNMAGRNGSNSRNGTRAVVTGMGAITPIGNSVSEFWDSCLRGRSGIGALTQFDHSSYPVHIAGAVKGFDPEDYMDNRDPRRMARFSQFATAHTRQ